MNVPLTICVLVVLLRWVVFGYLSLLWPGRLPSHGFLFIFFFFLVLFCCLFVLITSYITKWSKQMLCTTYIRRYVVRWMSMCNFYVVTLSSTTASHQYFPILCSTFIAHYYWTSSLLLSCLGFNTYRKKWRLISVFNNNNKTSNIAEHFFGYFLTLCLSLLEDVFCHVVWRRRHLFRKREARLTEKHVTEQKAKVGPTSRRDIIIPNISEGRDGVLMISCKLFVSGLLLRYARLLSHMVSGFERIRWDNHVDFHRGISGGKEIYIMGKIRFVSIKTDFGGTAFW